MDKACNYCEDLSARKAIRPQKPGDLTWTCPQCQQLWMLSNAVYDLWQKTSAEDFRKTRRDMMCCL